MLAIPLFVCLAIASAIAAASDVLTGRVPNLLTFGVIAVAIAARGAIFGWSGAVVAVATALAVIVFGSFVYERGWLGGGDLKLIAGLAAGFGPADSIAFLLYMGAAGGLLGAAYALREGRLVGTVFQVAHGALAHVAPAIAGPGRKLPYAVAIAAGATLVALSHTALPALRIPL